MFYNVVNRWFLYLIFVLRLNQEIKKLASYPLSDCVPEAVEQGGGRGGGCGLIPRGAAPGMAEVVTPKRQAVFDRLKRRIENYRRHQTDCIPRFNQSFTGLVEQNSLDTLALKQRFLESKARKAAKKTEKKIPDNPLQSLHAVAVSISL